MSDVSDHYGTLTKITGFRKSVNNAPIYRRKTNLNEKEWNDFNNELKSVLCEKILMQEEEIEPNYIANCISNAYF